MRCSALVAKMIFYKKTLLFHYKLTFDFYARVLLYSILFLFWNIFKFDAVWRWIFRFFFSCFSIFHSMMMMMMMATQKFHRTMCIVRSSLNWDDLAFEFFKYVGPFLCCCQAVKTFCNMKKKKNVTNRISHWKWKWTLRRAKHSNWMKA